MSSKTIFILRFHASTTYWIFKFAVSDFSILFVFMGMHVYLHVLSLEYSFLMNQT